MREIFVKLIRKFAFRVSAHPRFAMATPAAATSMPAI